MLDIKETTNKLFSINYEKDFENDEVYYKFLDLADELIKTHNWNEIYKCWYSYLINKCKGEKEILNFANLFWCYEGQKHCLPNPFEFCAYFYANISFKHYPDALDILDSITCEVLLNSGIYNNKQIYYDEYIPTNDPLIKKEIENWKRRK